MKKPFITLAFGLFFIVCPVPLIAQNNASVLNQVELMKQFTGSWKLELGTGSAMYWDARSYGTGFETNLKGVTGGKTTFEGKQLLGYNKKYDKYIVAQMFQGRNIQIGAVWFISETKYKWIPECDISNPEDASIKIEGEFKTPDLYIEKRTETGHPAQTLSYVRVKE